MVSHRSKHSTSSEEIGARSSEERHRTSFEFSDDDHISTSSLSSDDLFDCLDEDRSLYVAPNAPYLKYSSPPDTPRDPTPTGLSPAPSTRGAAVNTSDPWSRHHRPAMRLDLSTLPPPFASSLPPHSHHRLASPRPALMSRFSSDDGLSAPNSSSSPIAPPAASLTPGTESALSAFGIAATRGPLTPLPSPPLYRGRRRLAGALTPGEVELQAERRSRGRSPRVAPPSPLQHLVAMSRNGNDRDDTDLVVPCRSSSSMMDFDHARALYHQLLPGDHRFLRTGDTPDVHPEPSYFAVSL